MTTQEFSNTFDTLLNSYASQAMFGEQASRSEVVLDEYEKSVLLTQAQDIILKQYFQRTSTGEGFDDSARRQVDFSSLIKVAEITDKQTGKVSYDDRALIYGLPLNSKTTTEVLFILNEKLLLKKGTAVQEQYVVVPVNYKEYDRQMSKAFAQPLKKQAWRLTQNDASSANTLYVEIVPNDALNTKLQEKSGTTPVYNAVYKIRYIRRPKPIILTSLTQNTQNSLDIDGYSNVSECELNPILHMDILNKAVELALSTRATFKPSNQ